MKRRQSSIPRRWVIVDYRLVEQLSKAVQRLPRGSGVLVLLQDLSVAKREKIIRHLRRRAANKSLVVVDGGKGAARVHNLHELRRALLSRTPMILLSPIHSTRSHPEWRPIPRMRGAAYARLVRRQLVALGGMDEPKFRRIERLGFIGWAGIDAWL